MGRYIFHALLGELVIFLCAMAAFEVVSFFPVWPGVSGRDMSVPGRVLVILRNRGESQVYIWH